ncbi:MAG: YbaB/EbfC family nucleoid-associated protein [Thermoguttaceae bacterium]
MFGKIFEMGSMMKRAQEFSGKISEMNEKLRQIHVEGVAAGGMVTVEMNGAQEMTGCKIDPSLFQRGDAELLEDLIVAAANEAFEMARRSQGEMMQALTEGIDLGKFTETISSAISKTS